jgi:signal transduction histidine kinase
MGADVAPVSADVVLGRARVDAVLEAVERMAAGDLLTSVPVSPARDELDALAHGVNVLASELGFRFAEHQKVQAAMVQAGKLAALGEVTSGLAHELNNPLAILRGYLELASQRLRKDGAPSEEVWRYLAKADAGVDRMEAIIHHVGAFSRNVPPARAPISLDIPVQHAALLVREQLRLRSIHLELDLAADQLPISGDVVRLEQVFLNLLTNARDAICEARGDAGGTVTVRTHGSGANSVEAEVLDDGVGMTPDVCDRMFDPFFTTKEAGKGSGLGLSISHGILVEHQATVTVTSTAGVGTAIRLRFPRVERPP